ncbi:MAG: DUF4435 domain-containing protein [Muribaculaceae bacterium]|nr:DUF4435 domain-containing protein [Muribaculaceae bacterium]
MNVDKREFYRLAAKRFSASTIIYKVDALVHVEDEDDIWFWRQILSRYRPLRYKFLPGSKNEKARQTTGCLQCLKYKGFLSQRFFVCIDSDLRFLLDEDISASQGILQTYTYSWENHCCFAEKLQHNFAELTGKGDVFDFKVFFSRYSEVLYKPFVLMLYCETHGLLDFNRENFKHLISLQYRLGDENDNGQSILDNLKVQTDNIIDSILKERDIDIWSEGQRYVSKGLLPDNTYLFLRGHSLYNLIKSIGNKLCEGLGVDFEQNILKSILPYSGYDALSKIEKDIAILNTIPYSLS